MKNFQQIAEFTLDSDRMRKNDPRELFIAVFKVIMNLIIELLGS